MNDSTNSTDSAVAGPNPTSTALANTHREPWYQRLRNWLWGYDFFISYHWASGGTYAVNLAAQLRENGYEVFLDRAEYAMGDKWKGVGEIALRNTQRLVLIATREAVFESEPVEHEVVKFTDRSRHCIPIFFGDTFAAEEQANPGKFAVLDRLPDDTLHIEDNTENLAAGPAPEVVEKLASTHGIMRRRKLRQTITLIAVSILTAFAVAAGVFAIIATIARNHEATARRNAEANRKEAVRNLTSSYFALADSARDQGDLAQSVHWSWRAYDEMLPNDPRKELAREQIAWNSQLIASPLQHREEIVCYAFSPDGKIVLTGSRDNTARLWNMESGLPLSEPIQHDQDVTAVAFSADGTKFMTGCEDGFLRLGVTEVGRLTGDQLRHTDDVQVVAFRPGANNLFTGSDYNGQQWDLASLKERGPLLRHDGPVQAATYSPTGAMVAAVIPSKKAVYLWNPDTGEELHVLRHDSPVESVAFTLRGKLVVTGSGSLAKRHGSVHLWDFTTGELKKAGFRHNGSVSAIACSPDGNTIVTASSDGTARQWRLDSGVQIGKDMRHDDIVVSVTFSNEGKRIYTGSRDNAVRIWDVDSGSLVQKWQLAPFPSRWLRHDSWVEAATFSPDGLTAVTASSDETAQRWNVETGLPVGDPLPQPGVVKCAAFSQDGKTLVTTCEDKSIWLWNADTGCPIKTLEGKGVTLSTAFSADGSILMTGCTDGSVRKFDTNDGRCIETLKLHDKATCFAFSTNAEIVVIGWGQSLNRLGEARVCRVSDGKVLAKLRGHSDTIKAVGLSPDGQTVATGSFDRTVRLWDWDSKSRKLIGKLQHPNRVSAVAFSNNGKVLVTACADGGVRLWDPKTRELLGAPLPHATSVSTVAINASGTLVLSATSGWPKNAGAQLWQTPPPVIREPKRLRISVEFLTGLTKNEQTGGFSRLTHDVITQHYIKLHGSR